MRTLLGCYTVKMLDTTNTSLPCQDKLGFDTQKQAKVAAMVADYQHGAKLKVYRCKHCQLWHLSSV